VSGSVPERRGRRGRVKASRMTNQGGYTLIELLFSAFILGVVITGLALLLSRGQEFVVEQGDTRVALHLAQQKIEKLLAVGFSASLIGDRTNGDGVTKGCAVAGTNNEPCYNEVFSPGNTTPNGLGLGQQAAGASALDRQTFTRLTCVRYVQDDNPELPADPVEPPSAWTCPPCQKGVDPNCSENTVRIKVAVIPTVLGSKGAADAAKPVDPSRVTLEAVVTNVAKP
jgi:type II secretory pathway pseudopilin PulG